jgi:hypothetical protein
LKTHARSLVVGGLIVPLALALATFIANEAQTLIGLHLDNIALSIYLVPFLAGAAAAIAALMRLEANKIGGDLGNILGDLATNIFGPPSEGAGSMPGSTPDPGPPPGFGAPPPLPGPPPIAPPEP